MDIDSLKPGFLAATMMLLAVICRAETEGYFVPPDSIGVYERSAFSRDVTACDTLTSHPDDPEAVAPGVSRSEMDKPAAIEACRAALAVDPDNPRLQYQMGRAYGYSGRHEEADVHREKALAAGYPQSLFVMGYIRYSGWDGRARDVCYGGELIRRAALAGRFAGMVGFPHYALSGSFKDCDSYPGWDAETLSTMLDMAESKADGYYQEILVESLRERLSAQSGTGSLSVP